MFDPNQTTLSSPYNYSKQVLFALIHPDSGFNLEAESEKRKPTISSIEALDNDREKDKRRAENLLSIFEGEPKPETGKGKDQLIKAQLMTSPSAEMKMPPKEGNCSDNIQWDLNNEHLNKQLILICYSDTW